MTSSIALFLLAALHGNATHAAGPVRGVPVKQDTSTARYASDLVGSDAPKRSYAARVLMRRARTAWRIAASEKDGIASLEARQILAEFDDLVAPRCIRQVNQNQAVRACSTILGLLGTTAALPALKDRLAQSTRSCERRAITRAVERIEGAQ